MVLNHIYSRRTAKGGKDYFWPHDVEHVLDEGGKIVGAKLKNAVGDGLLPVGTPSTTRAWAPCPSPRTTASTRRR
jgi:leucyl-tRNA synthetase